MVKAAVIFVVLLVLFINNTVFPQIIIAQENFTAYQADISTVPAKWYFSYHGNYTSSAFSGASGPNAYKFGANNANITAPKFSKADSVKFWVKGSGTDTISALLIFESADSLTWDTLVKMDHLPTTAVMGNRTVAVKTTSHFLKFKYLKSAGNLAFDDYKLIINASNINFTSTAYSGCAPFCTGFAATSVTPIKSYQWDLGMGSSNLAQPFQCYANPGPYTVQLTIIDSLDNSYSITKSGYLTVYPAMTAEYNAPSSAVAGTPVNFSDNSIGSTSWTWNFFDPNDPINSNLKNPSHTFADTGTYCPVLLAVSNYGCSDTVKHCLQILPVSVSMRDQDAGVQRMKVVLSGNSLQMYPPKTSGSVFVSIYNATGILMYSSGIRLPEHLIDISDLSAGLYFIESAANDYHEVKKVILLK